MFLVSCLTKQCNTYLRLIRLNVVGLASEGIIEFVCRHFRLCPEKVKVFEYTKRCGCLWIDDSRREEPGSHELDRKVALPLAVAVVNPHLVNAGHVDDREVVVERWLRVRAALAGWVPKLNSDTEVFERRRTEVTLDPDLSV